MCSAGRVSYLAKPTTTLYYIATFGTPVVQKGFDPATNKSQDIQYQPASSSLAPVAGKSNSPCVRNRVLLKLDPLSLPFIS
jgi:hypothetical protein